MNDVITPIISLEDEPCDVLAYPPCTIDEENFALAILESGGNIRTAYQMAFGDKDPYPIAKGNNILRRPQVALKIKELQDAVHDYSLISMTSHLMELADIRDLAKMSGQLKTALAAEISRGTAVGIYKAASAPPPPMAVQVNFVSQYDHSV